MERLARPLAHADSPSEGTKHVTAADALSWPASLRGGGRRPPGSSPEGAYGSGFRA